MEERRASAWRLLLRDRRLLLPDRRLAFCTHNAAGLLSLHRKESSRTAFPSGLLPHFPKSDAFHPPSQESGVCITNGESVIWFPAHSGSNRFLRALTEAACQARRWAGLQPGVQNRRRSKASAGPTRDGRAGPVLPGSVCGPTGLSAPLSKPPFPLLRKGLSQRPPPAKPRPPGALLGFLICFYLCL